MLDVNHIGFAYPGLGFALKDISFSVQPGEFVVVAGKNGSGKTTLTRLIMSLVKPDQGHIYWRNKDTVGCQSADMAHSIGYVFQNPDLLFFHMTAVEEVSYGPRQLGFSPERCTASTAKAFAAVDLTGKEQNNPKLMTKGEKQRLAIACAIAMEPDLFILDEPTCGQDLPFRSKLLELMTDFCHQGKSVLVITHDRIVLEKYASRILVLSAGRLVFDGSPNELFNRKEATEWGLTLPVACTLSQGLQSFGIRKTASLENLAEQILKQQEELTCNHG